MIKNADEWQFLREYTVIYVCIEGEAEREGRGVSYKMQVKERTFASQKIPPL